MHKHLQNEFKDDLIDFRKPNLWMHSSVKKQEVRELSNAVYSFAILIAFILFACVMFYAIATYPKAYPVNTVTVNK